MRPFFPLSPIIPLLYAERLRAEAIPKHLKTIYLEKKKKTEVTTNKDTLSWCLISLVHDVTGH